MNKLERVRALENGKGIQYLLDASKIVFNNPIAMFDTNYDLKAYTDAATDDPIWNELIATGTFSMKTQEFFAKECFTELVANANKLVILKSSLLKHDRVLGNIYNIENIKVANLVMVGGGIPFEEEEMAAFEELVDKFTMEIRDDEYYAASGRAYHESIIIKLLEGIIKDPLIYNPHVQIVVEGFEDYLFAAVVDIVYEKPAAEGSKQDRLIYYKNLLLKKYPLFKYAVYSDYMVMIMSSKHNGFHEEIFFDKDDNPFMHNNLFVGISSSFENPYQLREYYDQAVAVLKKGIEDGGSQRIFS
ncbi:MAG: hypothetical protein FWG99_05795 [Treponema sp.]|nr:hypothetical protein [Treponema sp.]